MTKLKDPMHPGEVLKELYLDPLGIKPIAFAHILHVPRTRIERLVKGSTSMTIDTAMRLAYVLETTPTYWMNMQTNYDVAKAEKEIDLSRLEPLPLAAA
jgi:addiction module HigA family antidote